MRREYRERAEQFDREVEAYARFAIDPESGDVIAVGDDEQDADRADLATLLRLADEERYGLALIDSEQREELRELVRSFFDARRFEVRHRMAMRNAERALAKLREIDGP